MITIKYSSFWRGTTSPHYFHPAVCRTDGEERLMTLQTFSGVSDTYGPVECSLSRDGGQTWSEAEGIEALRTEVVAKGVQEGIADVRPFYHPQTRTVIAIGCNTFYGKNKQMITDDDFDRDRFRQYPVYAVRSAEGRWSERKELAHPFFAEYSNWRVACAQLEILPHGEVIIPVSIMPDGLTLDCRVCTVRCRFDGECLDIVEVGNLVAGDDRYAPLEPSLAQHKGRFYLTLRAHDTEAGYIHLPTGGCAFLAESDDGLNWSEVKRWVWDDDSPLVTSTTQQHWMKLGGKLFLVYTRQDESNADVFRWRAPLFMAEFDPEQGCLIRDSERVVLPLECKDGSAYLYGNFHVSSLSPDRCIVSDAALWFRIEKGETEAEDRIAGYESFVRLAEVRRKSE